MLTVPNTFGVFDEHLSEVAHRVHTAGGVLFVDGANLNALMGIVRLSDLGADLAQLNTHKTFSTPHGGGGPGGGVIAAAARFAPYLPVPVIERRDTPDGLRFTLDEDRPRSVGKVHAFFGNFAISLRALAYLRRLGGSGLRATAEHAVLNANYLLARLRAHYAVPYDRPCMHECLLSAGRQAPHGVTARDIGKRLMDYGVHPPNLSLPSTIPEPLLIEPTETESLPSLDAYVAAMIAVAREAATNPDLVRGAPETLHVRRITMPEQAWLENLRWRA
jgi:glycine dehydrogenase subunit 2